MQLSFLSFLETTGFKVLRRLSLGCELFLCRERATGRLLVAKEWPNALVACADRESRALCELGERGLAPKLSATLTTPTGICVLRPFVAGSTLNEQRELLNTTQRSMILKDLVEVLKKIHAHGWTHRDITPTNIVVLPEFKIQLVDWDLSEPVFQQNSESYAPKGTPGFSLANGNSDLMVQDWIAVSKICDFLGLPAHSVDRFQNSQPAEKRSAWWSTRFWARPSSN